MEVLNPNSPRINDLLEYGYDFKMTEYIQKGWDIFAKDAGGFIGYTLLYWIIIGVSYCTFLGPIVLTPPLTAGFYIVAHRINKGEMYEFGDFFKGFDFFGNLVLASILVGLFVGLGTLALIIPGIFLAVAYTFTSQFVIFGRMEAWDAMSTSLKIIKKNWFSFFGFLFLLGLINVIGILLIGLGLLVTIPVTICAMYAAYDDIVGTTSKNNDLDDYLNIQTNQNQ